MAVRSMLYRRIVLLLLAGSLGGCLPPGADQRAATQPAPASTGPAGVTVTTVPPPSLDPQETAPRLYQIEVYQIQMPAGSISRNETFWKPFDETFLGFNIHEALDKTGVRIGRAPWTEMGPLADQLRDAQVERDKIIGAGGKIEMPLGPDVQSQTIFWYDPTNGHLEGKDYGRSQNLYVIAYHQLARQRDRINISFAPAVRQVTPQLQVQDGQINWTRPDTIYALGISTDLSADECVVIAPSHMATANSLVLGRAFLMEDAPTQRMEHILVIVPRVLGKLEDTRKPTG